MAPLKEIINQRKQIEETFYNALKQSDLREVFRAQKAMDDILNNYCGNEFDDVFEDSMIKEESTWEDVHPYLATMIKSGKPISLLVKETSQAVKEIYGKDLTDKSVDVYTVSILSIGKELGLLPEAINAIEDNGGNTRLWLYNNHSGYFSEEDSGIIYHTLVERHGDSEYLDEIRERAGIQAQSRYDYDEDDNQATFEIEEYPIIDHMFNTLPKTSLTRGFSAQEFGKTYGSKKGSQIVLDDLVEEGLVIKNKNDYSLNKGHEYVKRLLEEL